MISICPKCAGKISFPENVDRQADCECPLCQARYSVAEFFQQVAPAVTILAAQVHDDNELAVAPAEASEAALFALTDGDVADGDVESEVAAVVDDQASTASFDVDLTPSGDDELATDSGERDSEAGPIDPSLAAPMAASASGATADHPSDGVEDAIDAVDTNAGSVVDGEEIEKFDDDSMGLVDIGTDDAESLTDLAQGAEQVNELGLDTDDFIELQEDDAVAAADAITADGDASSVAGGPEPVGVMGAAMRVDKESGKSPVEVVKPFDFKPSPSRVPASDFSPRVPRRSRNILADVLKFGIGGIVGLLLCQAGLWWIGQLDPLGLAPNLPEAISFLAPKPLRSSGNAIVAVDRAYSAPSDNGLMPPPEPLRTPESFFEEEEAEIFNESRASAFPADETADSARGDQPVAEQPAVIVEPLPNAAPAGDVFSESATPAEPLDFLETGDRIENDDPLADSVGDVDDGDFVESLADNTAAAGDALAAKIGLIAEPKYSRYDVSGSLEATRNALAALSAAIATKADVMERKALLNTFYEAANDLAERTAHAAPGADPVFQEVHNFLSETAGIAVTIGRIAARRLPSNTRPGVFLAGTVGDIISKDDQYQRLPLTLLGDRPHVFVLVTPATSAVASGDTVLVLGVHVEPTLEIVGYTLADNGPVVWTNHIVPFVPISR